MSPARAAQAHINARNTCASRFARRLVFTRHYSPEDSGVGGSGTGSLSKRQSSALDKSTRGIQSVHRGSCRSAAANVAWCQLIVDYFQW